MSPTVSIALFGIIPLALLLGGCLSARWGILSTLLIGWLFLPEVKLAVVGIPDYDKIVATNVAIFLSCLLFHGRKLFSLRLAWYDIPILLSCLAPAIASMTNELGSYDALSVSVRHALLWVIPYWIGRTFFNTAEAMRDMAVALVVGALIYLPLCLLEVRLSPQLNNWVYGFHQNQFRRNVRFDGYRPAVFMQSGLMVGMWMATGTVVGFWLWATGSPRIKRLPWPLICGALLVTTVLCKALYAILLMIAALLLLLILRYAKSVAPLVLLLLCIPAYMAARSTQWLPAEPLTEVATTLFGEERAQSLSARLSQEDLMVDHVRERFWFGWGGYRRSWPKDPYTEKYDVRGLDGFWTNSLGENGVFGLLTVFAVLLLPVALLLKRLDAETLGEPQYAATAALAISLLLFAADCLLNGMLNPAFFMIAGGLMAIPGIPQVKAQQELTAAVPRSLRRTQPQLGGSHWSEDQHG